MTYLELINALRTRIREDAVTSVSEATLHGAFVNDAKRLVEDAWQWSALRDTINIGTADGTSLYSLTGTASRATIESVSIPAETMFLTQRSKTWLIKSQFATTLKTAPVAWVQDGVDSNGDAQVSLFPTPDQNYSIDFEAFVRQPELASEDDILLVPHFPVQQLAVALAARERGEVGGQTAAELFGIAQQAITDAIGHDFSKADGQLDWYYA